MWDISQNKTHFMYYLYPWAGLLIQRRILSSSFFWILMWTDESFEKRDFWSNERVMFMRYTLGNAQPSVNWILEDMLENAWRISFKNKDFKDCMYEAYSWFSTLISCLLLLLWFKWLSGYSATGDLLNGHILQFGLVGFSPVTLICEMTLNLHISTGKA